MARKVATSGGGVHKKQAPIIKRVHRRKKLRAVFKKFFDYMISDTYMFSPSIHPQTRAPLTAPPSLGGVSCEPILGKEKKSIRELAEYMKCDCYFYAPLVLDSHAVESAANTGPPPKEKEKISMSCYHVESETQPDGSSAIARPVSIQHSLKQKEALKHMIRQKIQNCRPLSMPGKGVVSRKETRRIMVEGELSLLYAMN